MDTIKKEYPHDWGESMAYVKTIIDMEHDPFLILDHTRTVIMASVSYCALFGTDEKNMEGKLLYEAGNGQWSIPMLQSRLTNVVEDGISFVGLEVVLAGKTFMLNARNIYVGKLKMILLAMEDVTELVSFADSVSKRLL